MSQKHVLRILIVDDEAIIRMGLKQMVTSLGHRVIETASNGDAALEKANRLKPDLVAPGESVRSTVLNGLYGSKSGTSMAGPHVAGVVALLWSANPDLMGHIERTEEMPPFDAAEKTQLSEVEDLVLELDANGQVTIVSIWYIAIYKGNIFFTIDANPNLERV